MAENESLDLKSPYAQRWNAVRDATQKGGSPQEVVVVTKANLKRAFRKVLVEFQVCGVTTADFLAARGDSKALRNLVRKARGHDYAELLVSVLDSNPGAPNTECLKRWGDAILETVFDQISYSLAGSRLFPSFFHTRSFFHQVHEKLTKDLETMAIRLFDDPNRKPSVRSKKDEPTTDPTTAMLTMSLIGGAMQ